MKFHTWILVFIILLVSHFCSFSQCEDVQTKVDKFTDRKTTVTPTAVNMQKGTPPGNGVIVVNKKVLMPVTLTLSGDPDSSLLILQVKGEYSVLPSKGAYVIFASGDKWQFPESSVIVHSVGDYVLYLSYLYLKPEDVELLKKSAITDVRVDTYECSLSPWLGEKFQQFVTCAAEKNPK
jgi:hypothetical protein